MHELILLCDDDALTIASMAAALRDAGYTVSEATDVDQCLSLAVDGRLNWREWEKQELGESGPHPADNAPGSVEACVALPSALGANCTCPTVAALTDDASIRASVT